MAERPGRPGGWPPTGCGALGSGSGLAGTQRRAGRALADRPAGRQAEVLADLRAARTRLEQFRRINGRGPRALAEHNLVLDGPPDA
jgi:hypothetical protein